MRKTTLSMSIDIEVYKDIQTRMKDIGEDPDKRGAMSEYIEDAIKFKNSLIKAGKWVPSDSVDFDRVKISK